jgi:hypothetical protein
MLCGRPPSWHIEAGPAASRSAASALRRAASSPAVRSSGSGSGRPDSGDFGGLIRHPAGAERSRTSSRLMVTVPYGAPGPKSPHISPAPSPRRRPSRNSRQMASCRCPLIAR